MSDIVQWLRYGPNTFRDIRTVHSVRYDMTLIMHFIVRLFIAVRFNDILV
jgi:hypothetical protein